MACCVANVTIIFVSLHAPYVQSHVDYTGWWKDTTDLYAKYVGGKVNLVFMDANLSNPVDCLECENGCAGSVRMFKESQAGKDGPFTNFLKATGVSFLARLVTTFVAKPLMTIILTLLRLVVPSTSLIISSERESDATPSRTNLGLIVCPNVKDVTILLQSARYHGAATLLNSL